MKRYNPLLCITLAILSFQCVAQNKNQLQPGRMYQPGETLFAPRFGFTAKVPEGWEGVLPRESEVFLLNSTTTTYGEIFVFGHEQGDLASLQESWLKGAELSETIRIKALNPILQNGSLTSEITMEGEHVNKGYRGYAISRCSPSGPCITTLMSAPVQFFESVKKTVTELMNTSSFDVPSNTNQYADFDWRDFLSDKVLMTYTSVEGGSKETMIHLCKDSTFSASIKKNGFFKQQNPGYTGKLSGTWSVKSTGEKAMVQFNFNKKKLAQAEVSISIKDEKILSNGERYFVGKSDRCK